jgi:integrase
VAKRKAKTRRPAGAGSFWWDAKNQRWIGRVTIDRQKYTVADPDRSRAEARLEEIKARVRAKIDIDGGRQPLREFLTYWLEHVVKREVKTSTLHDYKKRCEIYITPTLGDHQLDELTPALIRDWSNAVRDTYALNSARQALGILTRALDVAFGDRLISYNPARSVAPPKAPPKEEVEDVDDNDGRALTPDQVAALLEAVAGNFLEPLYVLALRLGCRRGELLGFRWQDFDPHARTLRVAQQVIELDGQVRVTSPKTKSSRRTLPLTNDLIEMLESHPIRVYERRLKAGSAWQDNDLIFPSEDGGPYQPSSIDHHFRRACTRAQMTGLRFHDLRHTAITNWRRAGIDLEVAAALAGHKTIKVTGEVYSDPAEDRKRAAMEKLRGIG